LFELAPPAESSGAPSRNVGVSRGMISHDSWWTDLNHHMIPRRTCWPRSRR
jgi:hypothetical protein